MSKFQIGDRVIITDKRGLGTLLDLYDRQGFLKIRAIEECTARNEDKWCRECSHLKYFFEDYPHGVHSFEHCIELIEFVHKPKPFKLHKDE